jgi:acyl-CoA thioester hydrolase
MDLVISKIIKVRFQEVDSLDIVWHGHYVTYFEIGREAFGDQYDMGYRAMRKHGVAVPIVKLSCEYKRPLIYGDEARIETTFIPQKAAKIVFHYRIYSHPYNQLVATGITHQVFMEPASKELILTYPSFFMDWMKHHNITAT